VLHKIRYEDLIRLRKKKIGENYSIINKMEPYRNKYYFHSFVLFNFKFLINKHLFCGLLLFIF